MFEWIASNAASLIVGLVVLAVLGLALWKLLRDKKRGKGSCSCGGGCPGCSGSCSRLGPYCSSRFLASSAERPPGSVE